MVVKINTWLPTQKPELTVCLVPAHEQLYIEILYFFYFFLSPIFCPSPVSVLPLSRLLVGQVKNMVHSELNFSDIHAHLFSRRQIFIWIYQT